MALRTLLATTAVATAFSPLAAHATERTSEPLTPVCLSAQSNTGPLMSRTDAIFCYSAMLRQKVRALAGVGAIERVGGFQNVFEPTLKAPADKPLFVDYPPRANAELLRIIAVVPPKGFETMPIPVCAEQNNRVLGAWYIANTGLVTSAGWTGSTVSDQPNSSACKAFIFAARNEINQKVAAAQAGPGTATAPQPPPVAPTAVTPTPIAANPSGNPKL